MIGCVENASKQKRIEEVRQCAQYTYREGCLWLEAILCQRYLAFRFRADRVKLLYYGSPIRIKAPLFALQSVCFMHKQRWYRGKLIVFRPFYGDERLFY